VNGLNVCFRFGSPHTIHRSTLGYRRAIAEANSPNSAGSAGAHCHERPPLAQLGVPISWIITFIS
jgi:hypothetical protein